MVSLLAVAAWTTSGCGGAEPPPGSTLEGAYGSTLAGAYADTDGDARLERVPGEPLTDRSELAAPSPPVRELAVFGQLSDAQVPDEESPARVPLLDRLGPPFHPTFRPQEALSTQVLAAAVRSLNRARPQAVVLTGDLIDNAQANELHQALTVLRGGRVYPDSGARGYDGLQAASNPDPFFYRPDVDAPRLRGLLGRAQRPFRSPGLSAPWYPVAGNHEILAQGEIAPTPRTNAVAVGERMLVELDRDLRVPIGEPDVAPRLVDRLLERGLPGRSIATAPDPARRQLPAREVLDRLRRASGHGDNGPLLDYSFDVGRHLRAIVLDAARRDSGSGGLIRPAQLTWLRHELARAGRRFVVVFSHQPLLGSAGGPAALALLDKRPRVVAAVAGHTHRNSIAPRRTEGGGYWLVESASLADYPQQARMFRLVETMGGGVALETWMVDHAAPEGGLADTSRDLAFIDAQGGRPQGLAGGKADRNARLFR